MSCPAGGAAVYNKSMAAPRKFNKRTTAEDVVQGLDVTRKTFLVTGANSGIGLETARVLACNGAHVVLACRSVTNGQGAKDKIKIEKSDANVSVLRLDLADMKTVEECAESFKNAGWPLHGLILNAGVYGPLQHVTDDGFETCFQINHLAQFYLAQLLTPVLKASAPSRLVVVASLAHKFSFLNPADIKWEKLSPTHLSKMPGGMKTYALSKMCNILFANEYNERHSKEGIVANSLHPGTIRTNIARNSSCGGCMVNVVPGKVSIPQGAATSVYVATAPELEEQGGIYFSACQPANRSARSRNPESGRRLWVLSEEMIEHYKNSDKGGKQE